jgi:hypothetical protein
MVRQAYKSPKHVVFKQISLKHNNDLMKRLCFLDVSLKKKLLLGIFKKTHLENSKIFKSKREVKPLQERILRVRIALYDPSFFF